MDSETTSSSDSEELLVSEEGLGEGEIEGSGVADGEAEGAGLGLGVALLSSSWSPVQIAGIRELWYHPVAVLVQLSPFSKPVSVQYSAEITVESSL